MKYTLILFIVTAFSCGVTFSQTLEAEDTTESSDTVKILNVLDEINNRLSRLEEAADKEKVGYLKIIRWDNIYFNKSDCSDKMQQETVSLTSIDIEMISLIIRDGSFLEVQIFTIDDTGIERVFTNPRAPIGINSRRIHMGDRLTFQRKNNDCYNIFTNDIWQFRFLM